MESTESSLNLERHCLVFRILHRDMSYLISLSSDPHPHPIPTFHGILSPHQLINRLHPYLMMKCFYEEYSYHILE